MESKETRSFLARAVENKWVCLTALIVGFVYITVYGFLKNPIDYTASMIGRTYPRLFVFWGVFSGTALLLNLNYMYHHYGFKNKLGTIFQYLGVLCIMTTVAVPSIEFEEATTPLKILQITTHWGGALLFGIFFAAAIILFLFGNRKKGKQFIITLVLFSIVLAVMIALLISLDKSGIIESIPMWVAYIIIFLINFTTIFFKKAEASA